MLCTSCAATVAYLVLVLYLMPRLVYIALIVICYWFLFCTCDVILHCTAKSSLLQVLGAYPGVADSTVVVATEAPGSAEANHAACYITVPWQQAKPASNTSH